MLWCKKNVDQRLRTLGQDCFFRSVLIIGGFISLALVMWIIFFNHNSLIFVCRSSECFSDILDVFKFPIYIATTTLAVAGFVAVIFRSQQTAIQIQETIYQNTFKNYFDHKKDFIGLLNDIEEKYCVQFHNKLRLYFILFPLNTPNNFNVTSKSIDSDKSPIDIWIEAFNVQINRLNNKSDSIFASGEDSDDEFVSWLNELISVMWEAHIRFTPGGCSISESFDSKKVFSVHKEWNDFPVHLYDSIINVSNVFELLLNYCLPNRSDYQRFFSPSVSKELLDEKLKYVCGNWKIS